MVTADMSFTVMYIAVPPLICVQQFKIDTLYNSADIIEDLYSPRTAAMDFVSELVRKRGKENLQKFILFIVEIFKRYLSTLLHVVTLMSSSFHHDKILVFAFCILLS